MYNGTKESRKLPERMCAHARCGRTHTRTHMRTHVTSKKAHSIVIHRSTIVKPIVKAIVIFKDPLSCGIRVPHQIIFDAARNCREFKSFTLFSSLVVTLSMAYPPLPNSGVLLMTATAADLDYLPLPVACRTELRQAIAHHRLWPHYRHCNRLGNVATLPRKRLLQCALDLGINPERIILDYYRDSGAQFQRARHLEITKKAREWL